MHGPYTGFDAIPDLLIPGLYEKRPALYFLWREACHACAAFAIVGISHALFALTGYDVPLAAFALTLVAITYKEFSRDPRRYRQTLLKSAADWLSWMLPFLAYFYFVA